MSNVVKVIPELHAYKILRIFKQVLPFKNL